jgi:hypothetical protein
MLNKNILYAMKLINKALSIYKKRGVAGLLIQIRTNAIYRSIRLLPQTEWGDNIYAMGVFYISHGRLPTKERSFTDFMYQIKVGELLNPLRVFVTDKEFVKIYIKAIIGSVYNVPTIAVLTSYEQIDNYNFPSNCCIKPTHASGLVLLRRHNRPVNKQEIKNWLNLSYYEGTREPNYKKLQPKVIVEPIIFDGNPIVDYRFFCMQGRVRFAIIDVGIGTVNRERAAVSRECQLLPFSITYPAAKNAPARPNNWHEMIQIAETLSAAFGFVRVDMYSNGDKFYVGELTNCHGNANSRFIPPEGQAVASAYLLGQ